VRLAPLGWVGDFGGMSPTRAEYAAIPSPAQHPSRCEPLRPSRARRTRSGRRRLPTSSRRTPR